MMQLKKQPYNVFINVINQCKSQIKLNRSAMTIDQLKFISKNEFVSIQSHTVSHPILTSVSDEQLNNELTVSKEQIGELIGQIPFAFSYPNGDLSYREIEAVKSYYDCAFTTEARMPKPGDDLYLIPRYAMDSGYYCNLVKLLGVWNVLSKIIKLCK